ncbi:hypothetical protein FOC4_g10015127 [Fusarium odoratissimum]|uniref:Uncharacterized protein n=1 Tax=Fusarium oxysporum f. sp. cubense (strain race 4) TaxID=2502994 RepID=N1R9L8_FUSC4|nr:hypothetical protein FOC4_g10015127 [Fusarium odoratissimum]
MPSTKRKALAELSNNTKTRTPQGKESGDRLGKEVLPETDEVPEDQEGGDTFTPDEEFDWDDDDDDPFYYSRSLNEAFPVENGHPNAARYQSRITTLVHKLSRWARNLTSLETIAPSQKLSRSDRETTVEFRVMLANLDPGQLADNSIHHTPMKTQEVLVRVNLNPGDLFDLPNVPRNCTQRLVYLNVVVQVGADNIATKELNSTISKEGGFRRIAIHEKEIHNTTATAANAKHYTFCRKDSVASNFRVVGLWRNPALLNG